MKDAHARNRVSDRSRELLSARALLPPLAVGEIREREADGDARTAAGGRDVAYGGGRASSKGSLLSITDGLLHFFHVCAIAYGTHTVERTVVAFIFFFPPPFTTSV